MDETKLNNIFNNFIHFSNMDFKAKQQYIDIYSDYDNKIKPYFIYFHQELDELLKLLFSVRNVDSLLSFSLTIVLYDEL